MPEGLETLEVSKLDPTFCEEVAPQPGVVSTCGAGKQTRNKLLELAGMEDCREQTFAQMREALRVEESQPVAHDPQGKAAHYLAATAAANVFGPEADPVDLICDKSIEEPLKIAIGLEKESIVFYLGLLWSRQSSARTRSSASSRKRCRAAARPTQRPFRHVPPLLGQARGPSLRRMVLHTHRELACGILETAWRHGYDAAVSEALERGNVMRLRDDWGRRWGLAAWWFVGPLLSRFPFEDRQVSKSIEPSAARV